MEFKIAKIRNLFICSTIRAYSGVCKGVGNLKPCQQSQICFHCAKGEQVNSLNVITSVFRPKLSEEKKRSSGSQTVLYAYITFTPRKFCVFVCGWGGGARRTVNISLQKRLVTPMLYNEILSCLFSDVYD